MKTDRILSDEESKYINIQYELQKKINLTNAVDISQVKTVAGVDLAYWKKDDEYAACCIVVIDYRSKEVIERVYAADKISVPYIPGCLAFREIPVFLKAYEKLENIPDVFFFDGNGYLHPRHMGLATQAGIEINKPSIGIAKSYCKINDVEFVMPDYEEGSYTDIVIDGETFGRVLRTHSGIKPIFVSVGNMVDLATATLMTEELITKDSHIPIPTRLADLMTHEVRAKLQDSDNPAD